MADEILGNCYELITEIALLDYSSVLKKGESIFTQETPVGIGIIPDIIIGKSIEKPRVLLQVHHTRAERASEKKFWRNIGEYVDARNVLGSSVRIVTVAFDSGQKRRLSVAATNLMDGFLEVDRETYGSTLLNFAKVLEKEIEAKKIKEDKRLTHAKNRLKGDRGTIQCLKAIAADLDGLLKHASTSGANWSATYNSIQSNRGTPRIPSRNLTTLRRGLGKLLPVDDEPLLRTLLQSVRTGKRANWPTYFFQIEVANRSIGGGVLNNPYSGSGAVPRNVEGHPGYEIKRMTELFTDDQIVSYWKRLRSCTASITQACAGIREADEFDLYHKFVVDNFNILSTPAGMEQALQDCFKDPDKVLSTSLGFKNPSGKGVWLFDYVMTAIKAQTGRQQGYGYTQLGADAGFRFEVAATGGVVISPYIQRKKSLRTDILKGVSMALAHKLSALTENWFKLNKDVIGRFYLQGLFEDKIYKTAAFDPALTVLQDALTGTTYTRNNRHSTFLTAFTGKGAATCDVIEYGDHRIMWQSASLQGDDHKTKELCGRVGMMYVHLLPPGVVAPATTGKYFLVIDGTWKEDQLQQLAKAGFDGIYYVDDLDPLLLALK